MAKLLKFIYVDHPVLTGLVVAILAIIYDVIAGSIALGTPLIGWPPF